MSVSPVTVLSKTHITSALYPARYVPTTDTDDCISIFDRFSSFICQVNHLANSEEGISTYLYECNYLPLPDIDVSHFTPDSVLDSPNFSSGNNSPTATVSREPPPPGSIVIKKKRPSLIQPPTSTVDVIVQSDSPVISFPTDPIPVCFPVNMKRRKGAPTRSPLY